MGDSIIEEFFEAIKYSLDFANVDIELRWEDMNSADREEIQYIYDAAIGVMAKHRR